MNASWRGPAVSLCMVLMAAGSILVAQEKKAETKGAKKAAGRLPGNFGKLNLTDEQKTKIYAVQASYESKLDELNAQLKALKEKQAAETEAVLTPDQMKILTGLREEAKKKAASKAKAATPEKTATPAPTTTEVPKATEKKAETPKKP